MTMRSLARSLLTTKRALPSGLSHLPNSSSFLIRLRPLTAAASTSYLRCHVPAISTRAFSTRQTNDPNPNLSNRPPKETIPLDGCDFEHWFVVMEKPEGDPTRDQIIDSYIKTLAMIVGSEEEARMKIYSVSTRHYFAFGALVSEELSYKLKELPKVRSVLPDSYLDVRNKDYGGEPFINGQAVPYDPKYHEEWNNCPIDISDSAWRYRYFMRRRENRYFVRRREMQGHNSRGPTPANNPNSGGQYPGGAPPNMGSGEGQYQNAYPPPTQSQSIPGRDFPPSSNY